MTTKQQSIDNFSIKNTVINNLELNSKEIYNDSAAGILLILILIVLFILYHTNTLREAYIAVFIYMSALCILFINIWNVSDAMKIKKDFSNEFSVIRAQ